MPEVELPKPEELEDLKNTGFTRRVALTTAVYAVLLALAALGGTKAMKEMLLTQQQASDQWAFYQAKGMREQADRLQQRRLAVDFIAHGPSLGPEVRQQYDAWRAALVTEATRYNVEQQASAQDARHLEREREVNRQQDSYFAFAAVLLQIAIVMASVAILATSRLLYSVSFVLAVCGTVLLLNGYTLVVTLPFFSAGH